MKPDGVVVQHRTWKVAKICLLGLIISAASIGACAVPPRHEQPFPIPLTSAGNGSLATPVISGNSVEVCLNSRYSEHNLAGVADNQQIASVLWAAGKAPVSSQDQKIYISTPAGQYLYSPQPHSLSLQSNRPATEGAFVINCESKLPFQTGLTYMLASLASVSSWKTGMPGIASCPKQTSLYFGIQPVRGMTTELVAHSSAPENTPGWLPDPATSGNNRLEEVLAHLIYSDKFSSDALTLHQLSQLLWAGYGCTPHVASLGGRYGLTVPSAMADYYLTGKIYVATETGVFRYHNRNPATDLTTRDHRLELISSGDLRGSLRASAADLSQAPCQVIICLGGKAAAGTDQVKNWAFMEMGFVAANLLVQASAMGLGCCFQADLTAPEQIAIGQAAGIPSADVPQVIVSLGGRGSD